MYCSVVPFDSKFSIAVSKIAAFSSIAASLSIFSMMPAFLMKASAGL
jgi:hypothetical protein